MVGGEGEGRWKGGGRRGREVEGRGEEGKGGGGRWKGGGRRGEGGGRRGEGRGKGGGGGPGKGEPKGPSDVGLHVYVRSFVGSHPTRGQRPTNEDLAPQTEASNFRGSISHYIFVVGALLVVGDKKSHGKSELFACIVVLLGY